MVVGGPAVPGSGVPMTIGGSVLVLGYSVCSMIGGLTSTGTSCSMVLGSGSTGGAVTGSGMLSMRIGDGGGLGALMTPSPASASAATPM